jgi:hypothetical protein
MIFQAKKKYFRYDTAHIFATYFFNVNLYSPEWVQQSFVRNLFICTVKIKLRNTYCTEFSSLSTTSKVSLIIPSLCNYHSYGLFHRLVFYLNTTFWRLVFCLRPQVESTQFGSGPHLSIGPNWVGTTWKRKQNPVYNRCALNKRSVVNIQNCHKTIDLIPPSAFTPRLISDGR